MEDIALENGDIDPQSLSFADLMDVAVTITSPTTVPAFMSLMSQCVDQTQVPQQQNANPNSNSNNFLQVPNSGGPPPANQSNNLLQIPSPNSVPPSSKIPIPSASGDVTLPLRDVLSLMIFVASLEDGEEDIDLFPQSPPSNNEAMKPLLKKMFSRGSNENARKSDGLGVGCGVQRKVSIVDALEDYLKVESGENCLEEDDEEDEDDDNSTDKKP